MGTTYWARGTITFDPPLTYRETLAERFNPYIVEGNKPEHSSHDVMLVVEDDEVVTDDGILNRRFARTIVPAWPDGKNYEFASELAQLVELLTDDTNRTFTGDIIVMRETRTVDADFGASRYTIQATGRGSYPAVHREDFIVTWGPPQPLAPRRSVLG